MCAMALVHTGRVAAVAVACVVCVAAGYLTRLRRERVGVPREGPDGVRAIVWEMRRLARAAESGLKRGQLAAMQAEGECAIGELHRRLDRLRQARDTHDRAGHAIGAMVLHAGAALSLRTTDPVRARDAVRTVRVAGNDALSELDLLETLYRNFRGR